MAVRVPAAMGDEAARAEIKKLFDDAHELRYSHSAPGESADIVSLRVSAIGRLGKPQFPKISLGDATPPAAARRGTRAVIFEGSGALEAAVFRRLFALEVTEQELQVSVRDGLIVSDSGPGR